MNRGNLLFKKMTVPENVGTREIETVQLWSVRWQSRNGPYSQDLRNECEFFTSEEEATLFKTALENAFALIRHTSEITVTIEKEK